MTDASDILKSLYLELEAAHVAMLEHAEKGDWEQLTGHAHRSDTVLRHIMGLQQAPGVDATLDASLKPVIEHILELTGRLQAVAGPERDRLASEVADHVRRTRVNSRYGV